MSSSVRAPKSPEDQFAISPPAQRRGRETWNRILDAGVQLIEEGGYDAFTIAALCERAKVAPSAIYDRAESKDAVFLAVYDHAQARIEREFAGLDPGPQWEGLTGEETIRRAVRELGELHLRHAPFLHSIILIANVHPELHRRGIAVRRDLSARFHAILEPVRNAGGEPLTEIAVETAFTTLFSTLSVRLAYGLEFTPLAADDEGLLEQIATMLVSYLLKP